MPLYDYDCAACGARFEVIHGVHADQPTSCAVCGKGPVKKAFAAPAIHFKGSGWAKKERRATVAPGSSRDRGSDPAGSSTGGTDGGDTGSKHESAEKATTPPKSGSADGSASGATPAPATTATSGSGTD